MFHHWTLRVSFFRELSQERCVCVHTWVFVSQRHSNLFQGCFHPREVLPLTKPKTSISSQTTSLLIDPTANYFFGRKLFWNNLSNMSSAVIQTSFLCSPGQATEQDLRHNLIICASMMNSPTPTVKSTAHIKCSQCLSVQNIQHNVGWLFWTMSDLNQAVPNHLADESQTR